jgi:DNA-binding transcriptional ArsR family regulator
VGKKIKDSGRSKPRINEDKIAANCTMAMQLLSFKELAARLGMTPRNARRHLPLLLENGLKRVRFNGGDWRYIEDSLCNVIQKMAKEQTQQ